MLSSSFADANSLGAGGPKPNLLLDFLTGTLDDKITFTRSSNAMYFSSSGVLTSASNNVPRFEYNPSTLQPSGLLIEGNSTNLLKYSDTFTNSAWSKDATSVTTGTSITNISTSCKIVEDSGFNVHGIRQSNITYAASTTYTFSVFAKAAERSRLAIKLYNNDQTNIIGLKADLSAGTVTQFVPTVWTINNTSITSAGNGWWRIGFTFTTVSEVVGQVEINLLDNVVTGTNTGYTGDGTSGLLLAFAQLETGSRASSPIATLANTEQRSADNASITGTNFSSFYNSNAGAVYLEVFHSNESSGPTAQGYGCSFSSADNAGSMWFIIRQDNFILRTLDVITNSVGVVSLNNVDTLSTNIVLKYVANLKTDDYKTLINNATLQTDTSGTLPTVDTLNIGKSKTTQYWNGYIRRLYYYPRVLTDSEMRTLTK